LRDLPEEAPVHAINLKEPTSPHVLEHQACKVLILSELPRQPVMSPFHPPRHLFMRSDHRSI
jgi:hypothetical protein